MAAELVFRVSLASGRSSLELRRLRTPEDWEHARRLQLLLQPQLLALKAAVRLWRLTESSRQERGHVYAG